MPTPRGWTVVGVGTGLLVLWWVFGEAELAVSGTAALVAVACAALWVGLAAPSVEVARTLTPVVVQEGDDVVVRLTVTNRRRLPLPTTVLEDPIAGLGTASATLAGLGPASSASVPYRIVASRRGIHAVGPLLATTRDPLGLVARTTPVGTRDRLVVHPRIERLGGVPPGSGRDPSTEQVRPDLAGRSGGDFFTIREYRHGDDLRRVHWPTTARRDELMIRQLETPWQSSGLVVLDTRAEVYRTAEEFETAVRGAASIIDHLLRTGFDLEVLIGPTRVADAPDRRARLMEVLAGVQPHRALDLPSVAAHGRRWSSGGSLVVLTGTPDDALARTVRLLATDHTTVLVGAVTGETVAMPGTRASVVTIPADGTWAPGWRTWVGRRAVRA